jgi:hypothetical protein
MLCYAEKEARARDDRARHAAEEEARAAAEMGFELEPVQLKPQAPIAVPTHFVEQQPFNNSTGPGPRR